MNPVIKRSIAIVIGGGLAGDILAPAAGAAGFFIAGVLGVVLGVIAGYVIGGALAWAFIALVWPRIRARRRARRCKASKGGNP